MNKWIENSWNKILFVFVLLSYLFVEFIVKEIYDRDYVGVDVIFVKFWSRYWILKVKNIIKCVKLKCVICRKKFKIIEF